jgi:PTH2 family peptidyl-tRNA hydrolase
MTKQVIVIRRDLKLSKGKTAAQVAHASLEAYRKADPDIRKEWEGSGSKKVVLKVEGLREITDLFRKAKAEGLPCSLVRDAGRTEVESGTVTSLGIGPGQEEKIDRITGNLKML